MTAPSKHLERTRGRILARTERVRLASRVLILAEGDNRVIGRRAKVVLALTDHRLLLVSETLRASKARLIVAWPTDGVRISVNRPKLGNSIIHVTPGEGGALALEWLGGNGGGDWDCVRYRL